jgi:hypothetical protein
MGWWRRAVFAGMALLAALLAALHAPGQMSVDSGVALYEGLVGHAIGWGPTFFAAALRWLGGGALGASLFVALDTLAIYGCFAVLLTVAAGSPSPWRRALALLLVLNPLFAFYAGILWKDVMLASCAMVALTALLVASTGDARRRRRAVAVALLAIAPMALLRQQGLLLSVPLAMAAAWLLARAEPLAGTRRSGRVAVVAAVLAVSAASTFALGRLSDATISPLPKSPMAVGFSTIRAYDIAGMMAYARPGDPSAWSGADAATRQQVQYLYSPERIDFVWRDAFARKYFSGLGDASLREAWWSGIRHDPVAYASHRVAALRALLGFDGIAGCVPAYWGTAIIPEDQEPLGLREEMDPRDRFIGRTATALEPTPVFRHWFYAGMLLLAAIAALRRRGPDAVVLRAGALAAGLYLGSFVPTTIACDFRYLYPVACLSTVLGVWLLLRPGSRNQTLMSEGRSRSTGSSASDPA